MQKIFISIVVVVSMCLTSCGDVHEKAYQAELMYKYAKETNSIDTLLYKQEFIDIWYSMSDDERVEYRNYKSYMNTENGKLDKIQREAEDLLNE